MPAIRQKLAGRSGGAECTTPALQGVDLGAAIRAIDAAAQASAKSRAAGAMAVPMATTQPASAIKAALLVAAAAAAICCGGSCMANCTSFPAFAKGNDGKSRRYATAAELASALEPAAAPITAVHKNRALAFFLCHKDKGAVFPLGTTVRASPW